MPTEMLATPQRPTYEEGAPSQAELVEKREALQQDQKKAMERVGDLARTQHELSKELGVELRAMQEDAGVLDDIEARMAERGLLAVLTRAFTRRRAILQRRSVAEGLLGKYEESSQCLRRASAFADELRLCALELQQQVDQLHEDLSKTARNRKRAAEAVLALERALQLLETAEDTDVADLTETDRARKLDELAFRERAETLALRLFEARTKLLRQELEPARSLRDTVMGLHEEMARFVLGADSTINTAGRRIQALGMAADAPTVVAELHDSLTELGTAMLSTEQYVKQAQHLLTEVLPDLSARLEQRVRTDSKLLVDDLDDISRERARELADQALREAAHAELDDLDQG